MTRQAVRWMLGACIGFGLAIGASAQGTTPAKKDLIQKILQVQQADIEGLARALTERPAQQMMQEAGLALQRQVPPDKREAMAKQIEAEVKKYVEESYPLVRERALRIAPTTIGATMDEKLSEDELKQLLAWLESPVNKKYQALGNEMRNNFMQKLVTDARPVVDPKVQALDGRIRQILGVPPPPAASAPAAAARPAARASGK